MLDVEVEQIARSMRVQAGISITVLSAALVLRATSTADVTGFALGWVLWVCIQRFYDASAIINRTRRHLN